MWNREVDNSSRMVELRATLRTHLCCQEILSDCWKMCVMVSLSLMCSRFWRFKSRQGWDRRIS